MSRSVCSTLLAAICPFTAMAAGFAIPEQSARATAEAGTGASSATGGSTIFYNAALLGFESRLFADLSATTILPQFEYSPPGQPARKQAAEASLFVLPSLFIGSPISTDLVLGVGAYSAYGLGVTWPKNFDGRFESLSSTLSTWTLNPTAAFRVSDHVALGVGLDVVRATLELTQKLNLGDEEGSLRFGAGTWAAGVNAGVAARLVDEKLQLGVHWRSAVPLDFRGKGDFSVPPEFEPLLVDQAASTRLSLPHTVAGGVSYSFSRTRVAVDLLFTEWSSFREAKIDFGEGEALDQTLPRRWVNTASPRAGAEFLVTERLTLRAGAGFDPSPAPADTLSPSLPDAHRVLASLGAGLALKGFIVDLGWLGAFLLPRESSGEAFPARYGGAAHLFAATVSFRR